MENFNGKKKNSAGLAWKLLHSTLMETWKKISPVDGKILMEKKRKAQLV